METINSFAIRMAANAGSLNVDQLVQVINGMTQETSDWVTKVILGIVDLNEVKKGIPYTSRYDGIGATMTGYNAFNDEVTFKYTSSDKRWFKDREKADIYAESGSASYKDYTYHEDNEHTIPAEYFREYVGSMSRQAWIENAKQNE